MAMTVAELRNFLSAFMIVADTNKFFCIFETWRRYGDLSPCLDCSRSMAVSMHICDYNGSMEVPV